MCRITSPARVKPKMPVMWTNEPLAGFWRPAAVPAVDEGTPVFRDIRIADVTCLGAGSVGTMIALPEMPVRGFSLTRATFTGTTRDLVVQYFENPVLDYVRR